MKKQKVQAKINLEALAGGAFAEKLNEALMQVAENIQNPNTEATTKRQITVNIKFTPNKTRQMVGTQRTDGSLRLHGRRSGSGTRGNTSCSSYTGTESDRQASGS